MESLHKKRPMPTSTAKKTPTVKNLSSDEKFQSLSPEAKKIVLDKVSSEDKDYSSLSDEAKEIVSKKLIGPTEPEFDEETERALSKEPAPYLNIIPGGKEFNQSLIDANREKERLYPGTTKSELRKNFVKDIGGSIALGLGAKSVAQTAVPWLASKGVGPAAATMSIEGAAGAQAFNYDSIGQRIGATVGAAVASPVVGGLVSGAVKGAVGIGRVVKKVSNKIRDPRIPVMSKIRDEVSEKASQMSGVSSGASKQISTTQAVGREAKEAIAGRASSLEERIRNSVRKETLGVKSSIENTKKQVDKLVNNLDKELSVESDVAAKTFQKKVTGFFRNNSNAYGKELDLVSDSIAQSGRLTRAEAYEVLLNTMKKSGTEADVQTGAILQQIDDLMKTKYAPQTNGPAGRIGELPTITRRDMSEQIPFKEFLGDIRAIQKSVRAFRGGGRFSQEEIPAAILQSEFGELVSRLPGGEKFKALQQSYRPVISYMNKANSIIQPYKGEAYTKSAEALVKRIASGNAMEADKQLVSFIEQGTEKFGPGIGNVTSRARQIGSNIRTLKDQMKKVGDMESNRLLQIAEEGAIKLSKLDTMKDGAQKLVEKETNVLSAQILEEAARQEMEFAKRIQSLQKRGEKVEKLLQKRALIKRVTTGLGLIVSGLGGYGVYRGASGVRQLDNLNE